MPSQDTPPRRIGVFGGTFDPPHIAHLVVAIEVRDALDLDTVLLVVANEPWQKVGRRSVTPARKRLELVRAAVGDEPGLVASDLEIVRGGTSFTTDTLAELRSSDPDAEIFLILGADAAAGLETWNRAEHLAEMCCLVVVGRPGGDAPVPDGFRARYVDVPQLEISSSDLRERVASGRSIRHLVPDPVISLIREADLYGGRR